MADETGTAPTGDGQGEGGTPTDWEAKYKEAMAHSREWEKRAKANKDKADKLDEIEEAKKTELEKLAARAEKAEAELAAANAATERQRMVSEVAERTGVPMSLLKGSTVEELEASASAISAFVDSKAPKYPADKGGSPKPPQTSRESIEAIKDPLARVRARAENVELYK